MKYQIKLRPFAQKELNKLPLNIYRQIAPHIFSLQHNSRPFGCKKLKANFDVYRVRSGDYRIVYIIDDKAGIIEIAKVAHRREVYR